jgi:hypothetical protein
MLYATRLRSDDVFIAVEGIDGCEDAGYTVICIFNVTASFRLEAGPFITGLVLIILKTHISISRLTISVMSLPIVDS